MINTLFIVLKHFKKHIFRNLIAMVFVTLSIMIINISFSNYMNEKYLNELVKRSGLESFFYVSPIKKQYVNPDKAANFISEKIKEMKSDGEIDNYYCISKGNAPVHPSNNSDRLDFVFCGSDLLKDIRYPLSSGTWFDKYDSSNGLIPTVISYDLSRKFKIGEKFELFGLQYVIIGVLEGNSQVLGAGVNGNGLNLSDVFTNCSNAVIVCGDAPFNIVDNIVVKPNLSSNVDFASLKNIANVTSFDDLAKRYSEENKELLIMQTTVFMLIFLVSLISTSSNNFLSAVINRKNYSVYYMCGMKWKTAIIVSAVEGAIKLLIPATAGYILFLSYCEQNQYRALTVNVANIWFTALFLIVIFLLTSIKPLLDISRTSPVKLISEI